MTNKHEVAPPGLTKGETEIFNYFRDLTRTTFQRQNEVRKAVGLEPIKYRKGYMRHVAKGIAKEILDGKYPFPEGKKFWASEIIAKKIFNPMEMQRKLEAEVERIFTKDLGFATKSMLWTALKEIHLTKPLRFIRAQMTAKGTQDFVEQAIQSGFLYGVFYAFIKSALLAFYGYVHHIVYPFPNICRHHLYFVGATALSRSKVFVGG